MKILFWFCKDFYIGNVKLSDRTKQIEQNFSKEEIKDENVIALWITVETKEDTNYFKYVLKDCLFFKKRFKTDKVILIPFAHLTERITSRENSFFVLKELKLFLDKNSFNTSLAHFGSFKDFSFYSPADKYQVVYRSYPLKDFKNTFKLR